MKRSIAILILGVVTLTSCNKEKRDANACSTEFVNEFNGVSNKAKTALELSIRASETDRVRDYEAAYAALGEMAKACQSFYQKHEGVSCVAVNPSSNQKETVSTKNFDSVCAKYVAKESATQVCFVDEAAYLLRYRDVREAIGRGDVASADDHYQRHGRAEGRIAELNCQPFNEAEYLEMYPDVADGVRNGSLASGRAHYDRYGRREHRKSCRACTATN